MLKVVVPDRTGAAAAEAVCMCVCVCVSNHFSQSDLLEFPLLRGYPQIFFFVYCFTTSLVKTRMKTERQRERAHTRVYESRAYCLFVSLYMSTRAHAAVTTTNAERTCVTPEGLIVSLECSFP